MAVSGLYRRILPSPPAVDFASSEGKRLFSEALQNGTMEGFFKLISHFQTQSEPAYCGLASLSMVFNALAIDPGRRWKGPWRWYDESMLDCCEPLEKIKAEGITFGKVACVAQCAGAKVETFHTNQSNISDFRNHLIRCASSEDRHLIASYHREQFNQTGTGHFSPIGGYHAGSDMALILDVARFKYPPHWVPLPLLWRAMDTIDEISGRPRGFMLVSSRQKAPSLLYTISSTDENWVTLARYLIDDVPTLLKSEGLKSVSEVLSFLFNNLPSSAKNLIKLVVEVIKQEDESTISQEEKGKLAMKEEILREVRQTELFKIAMDISLSATPCSNFSFIRSKESLSDIASNVCCQGAALLSGGLTTTTGFCCRATSVKCLKANGDRPMTVVSGTVVSFGNGQRVDTLIPVSAPTSGSCHPNNCALVHPECTDVLTVLLLALPHSTWFNLKDESLLTEIRRLVSPENLPDILQQEVLHLRQQLHLLKKFKDKEEDDDPVAH